MANLSFERISFEQALANLLSNYDLGGGSVIVDPVVMPLINLVKAKLDEIIPEGEGLQFSVEGDANISDPLNILISAILNEATKRVLLNAPLSVVDPVKSDQENGIEEGDKTGFIPLPDNFLRFVSLKMNDWKRETNELVKTTDHRYKLQRNKYTRGGTAKPVAVISKRTVGGLQKRVIEYYSINETHNIEWLYYIQETPASELQINLRDALSWVAAGMILQITERLDLAKGAFEQEQLCYLNL